MWPVAVFLMAVVLFYWLAFCFTVAAWLKTIVHLLGGHFTRAAIWFCLGCGMLFWWQGSDVIPDPWDFDKWLNCSAWVVGLGTLATFVRWCKKQQAMQTIPTMPAWPTPKTPANDNQLVMFSLHAKSEG